MGLRRMGVCCIMRSKLSIVEKIQLNWFAWRDVRLDRFFEQSLLDADGEVKDQFVVSNHMNLELRRLESSRTDYQVKKSVLFWHPSMGGWIRVYKLRSMDIAITNIRSDVSVIQARIQAMFTTHREIIKSLLVRHRTFERDQSEHYIQLCVDESEKARKRFVRRTKRLYLAVIALLNKKILILQKMRSRLKLAQAKRCLRIQYYYQCASTREPKLPVQYLGEDRLFAIANISTVFPYAQELEDTQKMVDVYIRELGMLSQ